MATLMAGHRKMEESNQVRDDSSTKQALQELRAVIRRLWLQSPG